MQGPSYSERIAIVNRTRLVGAAGLVRALSDLNDSETERTICDRWLAATREDTTLCPDGWYQPPPGGVGVLIGHPPGFERMEYVSLRAPDIWPRDDIHFDEASLIYAYASPTNRATGLIGDIGVTLYRGSDPRLRDHLSSCIEIANRIAEFAEVGMELRELFHHGESLIADASARNRTSSATDSGARNIGHTVPWTYEDGSTTVTCGEGVSAADIAERIRR